MSHGKTLQYRGFTLIELLIVIAVLGVLAAVVLVAVNPIEQLARGRDSGRKTTIGTIGRALQGYYTSHNGQLPAESATWIGSLVTAGELKTVPNAVAYSVTGTSACTAPAAAVQNGYCYDAAASDFIIFTRMESGSEDSKCPVAADNAYFIYQSNSSQTQSGVWCGSAEPGVGAVGTLYP
jgi:prepilin-type N-terminal cleavage/methylation domain-containing protein